MTGAAAVRRAVLLHQDPDGLGGSQASMLAEAAGLEAAGWRVSLVHGQAGGLSSTTSDLVAAELCEPALFRSHPSRAMLRALASLTRFVEHERPAVAHLHLWSCPLLLARLQRLLPTLATCHVPVCPNGARFRYAEGRLCERAVGGSCLTDGFRHGGCGHTADEVPFGPAPFALSLAYASWTLRLLARCSGVIAPSDWQRRMLEQDGVPPERITVLAPPIRGDVAGSWPSDGSDASRSSPVPRTAEDPAPVVLAAGRLVVLKGFDHLLRASARTTARHQVHIAGEGPALGGLEALADDLGIRHRVRFLGARTAEELQDAVVRAAVVVVPSVAPETFGMVGPEALLARTPVVAYAAGGIADWVGPRTGAVGVDPGDVDALARALSGALSDATRPSISTTRRHEVARLVSPARHTDDLIRLYDAATRP